MALAIFAGLSFLCAAVRRLLVVSSTASDSMTRTSGGKCLVLHEPNFCHKLPVEWRALEKEGCIGEQRVGGRPGGHVDPSAGN